jgi:hypothetical protein
LIQTDAGKFQEARGKEGLGEKPWVSSSRTGIEWGHTCSDSKKFFIYCLNYRESIVAHDCLTQTVLPVSLKAGVINVKIKRCLLKINQ